MIGHRLHGENPHGRKVTFPRGERAWHRLKNLQEISTIRALAKSPES